MRMIRPYGRSVAKDGRRTLTLRPRRRGAAENQSTPKDSQNLPAFAQDDPHILIAQWISAIDKVIHKPKNNASADLRDARQRLGDACWKRMIARHESLRTMEKIWNWKLHPYGKGRKGPKVNTPREGRWFHAFAGRSGRIDQLDCDAVAEKLEDHLYHNQYRQHDGRPRSAQTQKGLIAARAESVEKSLPALVEKEGSIGWTGEDESTFCHFSCDPAARIWEKNKEQETSQSGRSILAREAGEIISNCYRACFPDAIGGVLTRQQIKDAGRGGELALWDAVRTYYRRLLSQGRKRKTKAQKKHGLIKILPNSAGELVALLRAQAKNRQINDLIRLGRLLHYGTSDSALVFESDQQSEIKRAENFARVWRTAISHAQRTVKRWVDPENKTSVDILGRDSSLLRHFDNNSVEQWTKEQMPLLFGARADLFCQFSPKDLSLALAYLTMRCRHEIVHFTHQRSFVVGLKRALQTQSTEEDIRNALAKDALRKLFDQDWEEFGKQVVKEIEGAKLPHFAQKDAMKTFVESVCVRKDTAVVLPRYKRVLLRLGNTVKPKNIPKSEDLKSLYEQLEGPQRQKSEEHIKKTSATLAKYVGLKMLYDGPFRSWLAGRKAPEINKWLDDSCHRAKKGARSINKGEYSDLIRAKAEGMPPVQDGEGINHFIQQLTALTASTTRDGYDSLPEEAKKQSRWIDDLLCEVVGRAFDDFLKSHHATFGWLLDISPKKYNKDGKQVDLELLSKEPENKTEKWLKLLYAVLHMIPRDDVSRLLHQFRKWEVLETKAGEKSDEESVALRDVLSLYLRMSEAKFEGQESKRAKYEIRGFFEKPNDFERVFPVADSGALLATQRGLRQIMRFGHLPLLEPLFKRHRISPAVVDDLLALEKSDDRGVSKIARAQSERKKLHPKLVKKKNRISEEERTEYCSVLDTVTRYRDLSAQVRLTNHLRLHSLMMKLWARLLDFAGLWERDLYFTTLALMELEGLTPEDIWPPTQGNRKERKKETELRKNFDSDGRVEFSSNTPNTPVRVQVEKFFSDLPRRRGTRNRLAHFDFLSESWSAQPLTQPNFTAYVNGVRDLMAYDRKLKNAVSKSIIGLMYEEGFELTWGMNNAHKLCNPRIETRKLTHFKDKKIEGNKKIEEAMHNEQLVAMVSTLFGQDKEGKN